MFSAVFDYDGVTRGSQHRLRKFASAPSNQSHAKPSTLVITSSGARHAPQVMKNRGGLEGHVDKSPEIACRGPPNITVNDRLEKPFCHCRCLLDRKCPASCSWQPGRLLEVHCPQFAKEVREQSLVGLVMCGEQHLLDSPLFDASRVSVTLTVQRSRLFCVSSTSRGLGGYQSICNIIASLKYQLGEATEAWRGDDRRAECARSTCTSMYVTCLLPQKTTPTIWHCIKDGAVSNVMNASIDDSKDSAKAGFHSLGWMIWGLSYSSM